MSLLDDLSSLVRPDLKSAVYAGMGFILTHTWTVFRGRRIPVTWTATFQAIKPVGDGPMFAKVSVLMNEQPCVNLHSCQVALFNDSGRDIESMDVLFTFYSPFEILEFNANISSSAKNLLLSDGFLTTAKNIAALPVTERPQNPSYKYLLTNREFHLPALNRGESATFNFWINSNDPSGAARVLATSEKVGVKLVSRPANFRTLNATEFRIILPVAVAISFVAAAIISQSALTPLVMAMSCVAASMGSGLLSVGVLKLTGWLRRSMV